MIGHTTTLTLRTAEGIVFSQPLAGPVSRGLAWLIDACVIVCAFWALSLTSRLLSFLAADWTAFAYVLLMLGLTLGYGVVWEWAWNGQTPGKRVIGLRVIDERGRPLVFSQIVVRNLLRMIDAPIPLAYVVGGVAMFFTRHCQRLGDLAAGTVVIRTPQFTAPDTTSLADGTAASFRQHPLAAARLRQRTTPQEAQCVLSALLRREALAPEARLRLYRELADHFREKVSFPPETTASLSDEPFLRNVADVIFSTSAGTRGSK
jgi:uncharacterized RDD family membrane protein YckC